MAPPDPPFTLVVVEPAGHEDRLMFVDFGPEAKAKGARDGLQMVRVPLFPDKEELLGKALRQVRVRAGLGLREASARLGLSPVDLSSLERGARAFANPDDHLRACRILTGKGA